MNLTHNKTKPITNKNQLPVIPVAIALGIYFLAHQIAHTCSSPAWFHHGYGEDCTQFSLFSLSRGLDGARCGLALHSVRAGSTKAEPTQSRMHGVIGYAQIVGNSHT